LFAKEDIKNLFFETNKDVETKLQVTPQDLKIHKEVLKNLKIANFTDAISWADAIENDNLREAMITYTFWQKYKAINVFDVEENFTDLLLFIKNHQYIPNIDDLKIKAETMYINNEIPYQFVEKYFLEIKPLKTKTVLKLLAHNPQDIVNKFHQYNWTEKDLEIFIEFYGKSLSIKDYKKKIESLIWDKKYDSARSLFPLVDDEHKNLYENIIKGKYDDAPKSLRNNELLLWHKFIKAHKAKKDEAREIILNLPRNLDHPKEWWIYQKYYSREFFREKNYKKAYYLATNRTIEKRTTDYADAEWLSGWLALEFLKNSKSAYIHFFNLYNNVSYPVSKSRAAYWLGRTFDFIDNKKEAVKWYKIGAEFPLYFYGQLSMYAKNEILGIPSLIENNPLPNPPYFTEQEEMSAINNEIVTFAYLLVNIGENQKNYIPLFRNAINIAKTRGEMSAIFEIVKSTKNEQLITNIARYLSYKNIYFVENLFPVLVMINLKNPNSHLIHAIIRQESGFHISAESKVGAIGFMQIMPYTAKEVAKKMNIKYNQKSLQTNPVYNILVGSYYINSLLKQFDGNQVLAIGSYNSGPNAIKRFIERYGDPRRMTSMKDIVNWIESVDYSETRDYIQRIVENSVVYEYVLKNQIDKQEKEKREKEVTLKSSKEKI
jgi:soluble lytic murein transglycosylase